MTTPSSGISRRTVLGAGAIVAGGPLLANETSTPPSFWRGAIPTLGLLVGCAGTKLFWNWSTCGTLPSGFPVFGSTVTPIK